jgi:hypothetical protein
MHSCTSNLGNYSQPQKTVESLKNSSYELNYLKEHQSTSRSNR